MFLFAGETVTTVINFYGEVAGRMARYNDDTMRTFNQNTPKLWDNMQIQWDNYQ